MQPTKCKIFLKGFCPKKELCQNSHDIKNCMSGPNCTIKNQCPDRHPPLCKNFVKNTCGFFVDNKFIMFVNCAFFHPANVTFMRDDYTNTPFNYPPPFPMPIIHSPCPGVTLDSKVSRLESLVQQLSTRLPEVSTDLAAVKKETTSNNFKEGDPETPLGSQNDSPEEIKEKPAKNKTSWWPFKSSEQQTGVIAEAETDSEGPDLQIFPMKDTSTQTTGENPTIMDINSLKAKVDNLDKIVRHQTDNYNLKTKVDTLDKNMKALAGKVEDKSSADSNLIETLENRIKQDLEANLIENAIKKFDNLEKIVRHQTDNYNLKTKVDTLDKNIKALAEKVENKRQTMDGIGTELNSLVKKVTHMHQYLYSC